MARGARRDERARRGTPKPDLAGATLGDDTDAATERARIKRRVRRCGDDATADATCRLYSEELARMECEKRMVTTRGAVETT
jgi:hypothetical protein